MVGGGEGAFIGAVHRSAAALDGAVELVCGAFASEPGRSRRAGAALALDPARCYPDYATMLRAEAERPVGERMEFVAIVTPNDLHLPVAVEALRRGFHVLCDKPATLSLSECRELAAEVERAGRLYGLTHPYAAYPVVVEARERIAAGAIGTVRKVLVEYNQGWLAEAIEREGQKQASWRTDPARAGAAGCMGDIGVHAFQLAEHVAGIEVVELCASLNTTVAGRELDDDGSVLLRFANGAHGLLTASQVATGEENALRLRVYGDAGAIDWSQQEPNSLWIKHADRPAELVRTAGPSLGQAARERSRVPAGHPEGYIEAFANIYADFAAQVRGFADDPPPAAAVPGIETALRGMAFLETVVASSASDTKWHAFELRA